jgi:hypothetical protein
MKKWLSLVIAFLVAVSAQAANYYVDFNAANDSANGTTTSTPWKRCPGMAGFSGSYAHQNGDRFIFKGGVTWPHACFPLNISVGGASNNRDLYGTDVTWFAGGSFSRPVFDQQFAPSSYTIFITAANVNVDNLEFANSNGPSFFGSAVIAVMFQGRVRGL